MHLNIKSDEAHRMAQMLARLTGESMTQAVVTAIAERLERERRQARQCKQDMDAQLRALAEQCIALPLLDDRDMNTVLYDRSGLPERDSAL
jgi:antitoxin VapB